MALFNLTPGVLQLSEDARRVLSSNKLPFALEYVKQLNEMDQLKNAGLINPNLEQNLAFARAREEYYGNPLSGSEFGKFMVLPFGTATQTYEMAGGKPFDIEKINKYTALLRNIEGAPFSNYTGEHTGTIFTDVFKPFIDENALEQEKMLKEMDYPKFKEYTHEYSIKYNPLAAKLGLSEANDLAAILQNVSKLDNSLDTKNKQNFSGNLIGTFKVNVGKNYITKGGIKNVKFFTKEVPLVFYYNKDNDELLPALRDTDFANKLLTGRLKGYTMKDLDLTKEELKDGLIPIKNNKIEEAYAQYLNYKTIQTDNKTDKLTK